jgi:hypothetical protein
MEEPIASPAPVYAPVPVGVDWSGFYVGGQLGYGWLDGGADVSAGDGFLGGLNAGYRWDFGQWVAGGEIDYDWTDISLRSGGASYSVDSIFRLKVSAGVERGRALVYGTGGWAQAEADGSADGLFGGLGVAYLWGDNSIVSGEWLYHDFDDLPTSGDSAWGNTVTLRYAYRF